MAGARKLVIEILGNAKDASKAFGDVRSESVKTEERLSKLSTSLIGFGAKAVAGGVIAIGGLKMLADSAGNYGEAVSKAAVILGEDSVAQLEDFADGAAKSAGISKTAAMDAAGSFAALGKQAGLTGKPLADFSTRLVQMAGDLASFSNTSVDEALQAIQSGLSGEMEPLKKYNIFLTDVALKKEYLALTNEKVTGTLTQEQKVMAANSLIFKQGADAVGDFARTGEGLAGQTKTAQANFENLKVELGEGLVPVFAKVAGGLSDILGALGNLPEGVKGPLASIAAFGAVGAVAVGALSMVAGQVIKYRDTFTTTSKVVVDGVETQKRSLNDLGRAAVVVGQVATALAATSAAFSVLNQSSGRNRELEDSINRVAIAATEGGEALRSAFADAVTAEDDLFNLRDVYEDFGAMIVLTSDGTKRSIEDVQRTFDKLSQTDPKFAGQVLDELELVTNGLDRNSDQYRTNREFIDQNRESLGLQAEAAAVSADGAGNLGTEMGGLTTETKSATEAMQEHIDLLQASVDPIFGAMRAVQQNADAKDKARVAQNKLTLMELAGQQGTEDYATAQRELADAQLNSTTSAFAQEAALLDLGSKMQTGAISAETFKGQLYGLVASGAISVETAKAMTYWFGVTGGQATTSASGVDDLGTAARNLPPNTNVNVTTTGTASAKAAIDGVVESIRNAARLSNIGISVVANVSKRVAGQLSTGGTTKANTPYLVGERGPEIVVPGSGYVVPTRRLIDAPTGPARGGTGVVVNVTAGVGDPVAIGRTVVDALKAYERTSGTAWRN